MGVSNPRSSSVRFADTQASVIFDLLRGVAALLVLFEHTRNLFFIDYPQLVAHRALLAIPYLLSGAGHQSVVVFFVLSGYFISGAIFRALERDQWHWPSYLLRRFLRLWIVLIPALLLCLFWDTLGIHLGHAPALYSGNVPNHMIPDVHRLLGLHIFFGNVFFLQNILTPVFGSDSVLWSLANEFWYYLLFPLAVIALWRRSSLWHRLVCIALFAAIAWGTRGGILNSFPIWLSGALLAKLPAPRFAPKTASRLRIAAVLLYLPCFFALSKVRSMSGIVNDYTLTVLTFFLLWILLSATDRYTPGFLSEYVPRTLARFSYTLYAVHIPLQVFIVSLLLGNTRWTPSARTISLGLGVLVVTLLYADVLAYFTEFRTDALRARLEHLFGMSALRPALPSEPVSEVAHARQVIQ